MGLFATIPIDEVTVQDIASSVEMTPAAVYYHFASKEQILVEGMEQFRDQLLEEMRARLPEPGDTDGLSSLITHVGVVGRTAPRSGDRVLRQLDRAQPAGRSAPSRDASGDDRAAAGRRAVGPLAVERAEAGVIAVALVSLLETSLASMLNEDVVYRGLGAKKFVAEVAAIANRIAGMD